MRQEEDSQEDSLTDTQVRTSLQLLLTPEIVMRQEEERQEDSLTDPQVETSLQLLLTQEIVQRQGEDNFASTNIVKNDMQTTLQRQNTEVSKQIFPEKEYRGLSPNFHIHEAALFPEKEYINEILVTVQRKHIFT
jgi:hypothetical protein